MKSYNYTLRPDIPDNKLQEALAEIRWILDCLREIPRIPDWDDEEFRETYDTAQGCYEATLAQARARHLDIPEWEGDRWIYSKGSWERI